MQYQVYRQFSPVLDALQVLQRNLPGARSPTTAVVAVPWLPVVRGERGAGAEAAGLTTIRITPDAAVVFHDRVQVRALAVGGR